MAKSKVINKRTDHNLVGLAKTVASVQSTDDMANATLLLEIEFYQKLLTNMAKKLKKNLKDTHTKDGVTYPDTIMCPEGSVTITVKEIAWILDRKLVEEYCDDHGISVRRFEKSREAQVTISAKRK